MSTVPAPRQTLPASPLFPLNLTCVRTELYKLPRVSREAGPQPGRRQAATGPADGPALAELHPAALEGDPQNGVQERGGGGGGRGAVRGAAQRDGEATVEG